MPYKNGQLSQGRKPKRGDFKSSVQVLIGKACNLFNLKITTINAFPSMEDESRWAQEAWSAVCHEAKIAFTVDASERVLLLVRYSICAEWWFAVLIHALRHQLAY